MKKQSIEVFVPVSCANDATLVMERFGGVSFVTGIYLWRVSDIDIELPSKAKWLTVDSLTSTKLFVDMAERATADFVLYIGKAGVDIYMEKLLELCNAIPEDASMAYAHYHKRINGEVYDAPTIDCLEGALRNDFDFGPVRIFRTAFLKLYLLMQLDDYSYAGLYQLRLTMGRLGRIYHYNEYLSLENEDDNRKSGEKQFDYVNPAQREVQIEMEKACAAHLKLIDALLPPCKYKNIVLSEGDFPVEASVVIPVLNRESTIADAISSVLGQKTSFQYNVIVVNNHSTDNTGVIIDSFNDDRVVHVIPEQNNLGIGGCWNLAVNDSRCGRFAVQLDSDDLYSDCNTLQRIVDEFYRQNCAMLVGTYRICDFELNTLPPGIIDHREWTEDNGRNNALRINGLGAPRAFYTPVIREVGFPNVSYGEDYAVGLRISRDYRIGRIYDVLYLCRRWGGNSDASLSHDKVNANNLYKDTLRTVELLARKEMMQVNKIPLRDELENFFNKQLSAWCDVAERFNNLDKVKMRSLCNGLMLQYNPARVVSASAKVDEESIKQRKCFLCDVNRPRYQVAMNALGKFDILVNPYPILPFHFTLALKKHTPQLLEKMYVDMLLFAKEWPDMAIFYNGAKCGASAPDHAHLQAVRKNNVPLLTAECIETVFAQQKPLFANGTGGMYKCQEYVVPLFIIKTSDVSGSVELMQRLLSAMPCVDDEAEPRMNLFCECRNGECFTTFVVPRSVHRPSCYSIVENRGRMVSPGALDVAGLVVTPREGDFLGITPEEAVAMLNEVAVDSDMFEEIVNKIVSCHEEH